MDIVHPPQGHGNSLPRGNNYRHPDQERVSSIYSSPLSPVQLTEDVQKLDCSLNARPFADCCCDGLVFLFASDGLNKQYMLWNPSTRESIVLPHQEFSLSCCMYGLAYDAASDDYKILKIDITSVGPEVFNEILALKSGSWKRVGKPSFRVLPVACGVPSGRDCLAFIHGTFHWVGLSNYGSTIVSIMKKRMLTYVSLRGCFHDLKASG
ncbi:hypothetical protein P3S68_033594 [Capsicum galapagoense]